MSILEQYSDEEFAQILNQSSSYTELVYILGYQSRNGSNVTAVKRSIEHFKLIKRNPDNIFIENSTASQHVLRDWYIKGEYTPYVCSICGQLPEWQGKPLTLILDHINGTNKDNRLENLRWVCPNCNQQLDTTGFKKMRVKQHAKKYYCMDCGKEISKGCTRCLQCANKYKAKTNKMIISREELKNKIRVQAFTSIATEYGVTDNAVRKWCDKYNLPRKKSEIKSYSDEEWSKI